MRAERIMPSQIGGSGSFMCVVGWLLVLPAGNEKTIHHALNLINTKMQNF